MKSIIFYLLILFSLISCIRFSKIDKDIDARILEFGEEIVKNPEKLYDIKNNFPKIYNEEYTRTRLKDHLVIDYLINFIKESFKNNTFAEFSRQKDIWPFDDYNKNILAGIDKQNIYCYELLYIPKGLVLLFVKKGADIYLIDITDLLVDEWK
jgi:hypothetical protein